MMLSNPTDQPLFGRQQLVLALQERIEQGRYPPGSWLPAERALASEFGMDRSAVRSALLRLEELGLIVREAGKRPWVRSSPAPPRRPDQAAPPAGGPAAETQRLTIVAILPQHPVFPASFAIMHGINTALRSAEAPFRLQIIDTHGGSLERETALERQALDLAASENVAGIVLWHLGGAETLPQLCELERRGIPVVFVDRFPPEIACDFVGCDNYAGIEAAIDYLRGEGHQRIAHLTTDEASTAVIERRAAYQATMQAEGLALPPAWIYSLPQHSAANVAPACDHFFALPEPPTAVLAMNDALAYRFIAECEARGRKVPENISVIGFDDLERHSPRPPVLTTLHQPFDKMGRRAAEMLLRRLSGAEGRREPHRHILLPTLLVKRSTCRTLEH